MMKIVCVLVCGCVCEGVCMCLKMCRCKGWSDVKIVGFEDGGCKILQGLKMEGVKYCKCIVQ